MYDSPIEFCPVCRVYVALDQAQAACALEQKCRRDASQCPLAALFAAPRPVTPAAGDANEIAVSGGMGQAAHGGQREGRTHRGRGPHD